MISAFLGAMLLWAPNEVYTSPAAGLSFEFPDRWHLRPEPLYDSLEIPLPRGSLAEVQLTTASYRLSPENWTSTQAGIAESLDRKVDQTWQQVLGGQDVYFLRTKPYAVRDSKMVQLSGLVMASRPEKLFFRLTAPVEDAPLAEAVWLEVLTSLHNIGSRDPNDLTRVVPPVPLPDVSWERVGMPDGVRQQITASFGPAAIELPPHWTLTDESVQWRLSHHSLKGTVTVEFFQGDVHAARTAVRGRVIGTLGDFTSVRLRVDPAERRSPNLVWINMAERFGRSSAGELVRIHASGYLGGHYWVLEYRAPSEQFCRDDRPELNRLIDYLMIAAPSAVPSGGVTLPPNRPSVFRNAGLSVFRKEP